MHQLRQFDEHVHALPPTHKPLNCAKTFYLHKCIRSTVSHDQSDRKCSSLVEAIGQLCLRALFYAECLFVAAAHRKTTNQLI